MHYPIATRPSSGSSNAMELSLHSTRNYKCAVRSKVALISSGIASSRARGADFATAGNGGESGCGPSGHRPPGAAGKHRPRLHGDDDRIACDLLPVHHGTLHRPDAISSGTLRAVPAEQISRPQGMAENQAVALQAIDRRERLASTDQGSMAMTTASPATSCPFTTAPCTAPTPHRRYRCIAGQPPAMFAALDVATEAVIQGDSAARLLAGSGALFEARHHLLSEEPHIA